MTMYFSEVTNITFSLPFQPYIDRYSCEKKTYIYYLGGFASLMSMLTISPFRQQPSNRMSELRRFTRDLLHLERPVRRLPWRLHVHGNGRRRGGLCAAPHARAVCGED